MGKSLYVRTVLYAARETGRPMEVRIYIMLLSKWCIGPSSPGVSGIGQCSQTFADAILGWDVMPTQQVWQKKKAHSFLISV